MNNHFLLENISSVIRGGKNGLIAAVVAWCVTGAYVLLHASSVSVATVSYWIFVLGGPIYALSIALLLHDWRALIGPIIVAYLFFSWTFAPALMLLWPIFFLFLGLAVLALALPAHGYEGRVIVAASMIGCGVAIFLVTVLLDRFSSILLGKSIILTFFIGSDVAEFPITILILTLLGRPVVQLIAVTTPLFGIVYGAVWEASRVTRECP